MAAKKIALFIDADNISPKYGKQIVAAVESRGEVFIRRIYGNWEKISLHGWNDCILNFSLRAVQQPDFVTGKNATDMSLTIDAMDVLHEGKAEIFALVSNDSDFTPLVIRLREGGMTIIGLPPTPSAPPAVNSSTWTTRPKFKSPSISPKLPRHVPPRRIIRRPCKCRCSPKIPRPKSNLHTSSPNVPQAQRSFQSRGRLPLKTTTGSARFTKSCTRPHAFTPTGKVSSQCVGRGKAFTINLVSA